MIVYFLEYKSLCWSLLDFKMLTLLTFDLCVCFQLSLETLYQHCDFDENKALDVIYSSVKIAQEACLEVKRY